MNNSNHKIAYIDFDGTLVKSHCVNYLIQIQARLKNRWSFWLWRIWLQLKAPYFHLLNKISASKFDEYYYSYFKGLNVAQVDKVIHNRLMEYLSSKLLPDAITEIQTLRQQGYHIVAVSASLRNIVEPFVRSLGADACLATELEIENGHYTGKIKGQSINHQNKLKAIQTYEQQQNIQAQHSIAYGNSQWDIPMLNYVDRGYAVNADKNLERWAKSNGNHAAHWQLEHIPLRFHVLYCFLRPFIRHQQGLAYIPRQGGVIIIANHTSYLDHYLIGLSVMCRYGRRVRFLAKKEHFEKSWERGIHEWLGAFPIDREKNSKQSLLNVVKLLNNNEIVLIYPEGTRSPDGKLQAFKPGVLFTHYHSGCPIVPAGIKGAFEVLPKGRLMPRPARMSLKFGPPICYFDVKNSPAVPRGEIRKQELTILREQVKALCQ